MTYITNILFFISTGLLIPVIILLLVSFIWSLVSLGELYGHFIFRLRHRKLRAELEHNLKKNGVKVIKDSELFRKESGFSEYATQMIEADFSKVHCEKILNDFQAESERRSGTSTILARTAPMLGLMGTLIPMGPALTGLASGDISSMATNMQVAFATTVVGIFTGGAGYLVNLLKKRWDNEDYDLLEYIYELSGSDR
ncbi:MAG: MotA/TolQ/ExbB proton channel family protein [Candidatus Muiribacteriaceae bacterium]